MTARDLLDGAAFLFAASALIWWMNVLEKVVSP